MPQEFFEVEDTPEKRTKLMRLATIGMWNTQERERLTTFRTENAQDVHDPIRIKKFSEKSTSCFHSTLMHDNRAMLPIALQCLYAEQIHMDRSMRLIERLPDIVPLAARSMASTLPRASQRQQWS